MKTLGIDFGTSNSAAGYVKDGKPHLIEMETGQNTLPTSVFFDFDSQSTFFGENANTALIEGEYGRFMRALKSVLGTSLMREKRRLMGERLDFIDIIARFLSEIKRRAEIASGQEFRHALSGRPVHFHSEDAKKDQQALIDLRECYLRAGFDDVDFMFEPEAAALANHKHLSQGKIGLIIDIGGGTSDFSVFKTGEADNISVIASHGVRVGGTDFDRKISIDHVMPLLGKGSQIRKDFGTETITAPNGIFHSLATWEKIPFLYTPESRRDAAELKKYAVDGHLLNRLTTALNDELGHDMAFAVERGKIDANRQDNAKAIIDLNVLERGLSADLSQQNMQNSLADLTAKIDICAQETLKLAGLTASQIDSLVFVGGSSLMAIVETMMLDRFPTATPHRTSAFTAVVEGLALAADQADKRFTNASVSANIVK
ncbi:MAG: Hsp70 family protein [Rhodobacteraceae bacterium]|nr:Hsp70 family protein [Paracoccaceae bacterium]